MDKSIALTHRVVRNDELQFSVWRTDRPLPSGWYATDKTGTRDECLAHIGRVWTDMRPFRQRTPAQFSGRSSNQDLAASPFLQSN